MKVKDLIMKLIYCDPEAEVKCLTHENENEDADEFALNIRTLEDYEDNVDLVLDNLGVGRFNKDKVFEILREKVLDWAKNKDLLHEENAEKQFMKFMEEVFEFRDEWILCKHAFNNKILFKRKKEMKLEMGDIFVTLIILCEQLGISPEKCLEMAYNKISTRKGKTINGIFVKEEDLNGI
nr:MazG-like family protein [uncultured Peptoniphilus sp.]